MAPARSAAAEPGQAAQPPAVAERRMGPRVRQRGRQPAALHGAVAPQARTRPGQAALADHRAGHGIPLSAARARRPASAGIGPSARDTPRSRAFRRAGKRAVKVISHGSLEVKVKQWENQTYWRGERCAIAHVVLPRAHLMFANCTLSQAFGTY